MECLLLKAVENGGATPSYELILRVAALFSRHDAIPFIIKDTRRTARRFENWLIIG